MTRIPDEIPTDSGPYEVMCIESLKDGNRPIGYKVQCWASRILINGSLSFPAQLLALSAARSRLQVRLTPMVGSVA